MAKQYDALTENLSNFILEQKIFFVATATADSRVNLSPKGMDSLRILSPNRVAWLNVTGSGNESAAHVQVNPRMTIMFAAFEGNPLILRLYGQAKVVHPRDAEWAELAQHFTLLPGARQIFDVRIEMVQRSCGMAVPFFDYKCEREQLSDWATRNGEDGMREYWDKTNRLSIDGLPTGIFE
jgi:hypothetical protein